MAQNRWIMAVVVVLPLILCACGKNINKAADDWLNTRIGPAVIYPIVLDEDEIGD